MPESIPADSVGLVKPSTIHIDTPLQLDCGKTLPSYDLVYETYGSLNEDGSNAVLICHALSGDHHAAGFHTMDIANPVGGIQLSVQARRLIPTIFMWSV
jgi:homoserine O-acetyltransferase